MEPRHHKRRFKPQKIGLYQMRGSGCGQDGLSAERRSAADGGLKLERDLVNQPQRGWNSGRSRLRSQLERPASRYQHGHACCLGRPLPQSLAQSTSEAWVGSKRSSSQEVGWLGRPQAGFHRKITSPCARRRARTFVRGRGSTPALMRRKPFGR